MSEGEGAAIALRPSGRSSGRPAERIAVWLLAIVPGVMLAVLLQRPVWDVDIFWQLKLGELILARSQPLGAEPFAAAHLDEPLPAFAWAGQAIMAKVRLISGWDGLRILDASCWLGGFIAVAVAARRRAASGLGVLLGLAAAFLLAEPTASLRPQSFAVLSFGLLLSLLSLELRPWKTVLLAAPLLVVWQNLHPSVTVALAVLAARAAVDWARWLRARQAQPWESTALALLAALASIATPDGWSAFGVSAWNAEASVLMGVTEWLPLWDPVNLGWALRIAVACAAITVLLVINRSRVDLRELASALVLLAMTGFAVRFVVFWAIALIPLIARAVPSASRDVAVPRWLAPVLLLAAALLAPPTRFSADIPLAGLERLHDRVGKGTVFTHVPWGGPAIDRGFPGWRTAYDGRFYRFSRQEWAFYRAIATGRVPLADVAARFRPVAFALDPAWNRRLIAELRADPAWVELPGDRRAALFVRHTTP